MKRYTVYVIVSETKKMYIGQTKNIKRRIWEHNTGCSLYTRRCQSWKLIYSEEYPNRSSAMQREQELKMGKNRDWLRKIAEAAEMPDA